MRMPVFLFVYFFVEVLAFMGVAKLIGIGWAFLAILALMLIGGVVAGLSMRSTLTSAAEGKSSLGSLAGDSALLIAGWALCVIPGFVSSLIGLLMVLSPTRTLMRRALTTRVRKSMEDFGMQIYNASPVGQQRASYGSFTAGAPSRGESRESSHEVIDADELEQWYRMDGHGPADGQHRGGTQGGAF